MNVYFTAFTIQFLAAWKGLVCTAVLKYTFGWVRNKKTTANHGFRGKRPTIKYKG